MTVSGGCDDNSDSWENSWGEFAQKALAERQRGELNFQEGVQT